MKENLRRCFKCGLSPAEDQTITLFRFPKPGKTNTLRCELWARYCLPDREWLSPEFQHKLHSEHKMLCSRHFQRTSFSDYPLSTKKLHRFAVPDDISNVESSGDDCGETAMSDDDDLLMYPDDSIAELADEKDESAEEQNLSSEVNDLHDGFKCNYCSGDIKGYRYTCVQCLDYDLCGACEAKGAHCLHYVLRIPSPRPFAEIQSVINRIRSQLLCGVDKQPDILRDDEEIKEEVKDEDDIDPDPLRIEDALQTAHDDLLHTETEENVNTAEEEIECTVPESTVVTEPLGNNIYVIDTGTNPSLSTLFAINTEVIDGNTVLTIQNSFAADGASSSGMLVPIQARAKRKECSGGVANLALSAMNDAKRLKVAIDPLPLNVLRSYGPSSLSQGEKLKTRHKKGVQEGRLLDARVAAADLSETVVSRQCDDAEYLDFDILELQ